MALQSTPVTTHSFPKGLNKGETIVINGRLQAQAKRFSINLLCQNGDDIAFHFNPRFDEGQVVVCNTRKGKCWGSEKRFPKIPIQEDADFELSIHGNNHCYEVFVHNCLFLRYESDFPFSTIRALEVKGDVSVTSIRIGQQQSSKSSFRTYSAEDFTSCYKSDFKIVSGAWRGPSGPSESTGTSTWKETVYRS